MRACIGEGDGGALGARSRCHRGAAANAAAWSPGLGLLAFDAWNDVGMNTCVCTHTFLSPEEERRDRFVFS